MQKIWTSGCQRMCFCKYCVLCLSFIHPLLHTPHFPDVPGSCFMSFFFSFLFLLNFFTPSSLLGTSPASSTLRYSMWHPIPAWTITLKVPWMSLSWPSYLFTGIQIFIRNLFTRTTFQPQIITRSRCLSRTSESTSSTQILHSCTTHGINIHNTYSMLNTHSIHSSTGQVFSTSLQVHLKVMEDATITVVLPKKFQIWCILNMCAAICTKNYFCLLFPIE